MPSLRAIACAALLTVGCGGRPTKIEGPPPPVGAAVPLPPAAGSDSGVGSGFKPGPGGFPVPSDADAGKPVGADDTGYNIARPKDAVYAQLRPELEKLGFKIESYIPQPKSHQLIMYKDNYKFTANVTEIDAASSTLLITVGPMDK
ncbi:MAG: hypothetical protein H0T42_14770 [Deltaproteobacteria bacterium]|nr:hypothetical protein [Deltaproteobacteria bacterium]